MRNVFFHIMGGAALMFNAALASAQAETTGGKIEGIEIGGVNAFLGVPYAAPPVGELRWKAPQPVPVWQGLRKADTLKAPCMQDARTAKFMGAKAAPSEDCLYLNVWAPATARKNKLPVMVWIHGGAFVSGTPSASAEDGKPFIRKGVILVSIAYRLGVFGFLAHPALSTESGHGSGTYGLQDQIAGLKWVKENIANFGGDPDNVTIFGESAGAISVSMLAASPQAKGLFAKAISESGGSFAGPQFGGMGGMNVPPLKTAEALGVRFLSNLGVGSIEEARHLSAEKIQAVAGPQGLMFWPAFDGYALPGDQYLLYKQGKYNDTPILIGTNSDEGALFMGYGPPEPFERMIRTKYGAKADDIIAVYPHATPAENFKADKDIFRDSAFAWHTWAWAHLQSQTGKGKVFVYYFDHKTPQSPDGATHAAEVSFVFGHPGVFGQNPDADDQKLSDQMMGYWTNFARTGNPNGDGLPYWPAYTSSDEKVMSLAPTTPIAYPNKLQLKTLDEYYAWRRQQADSLIKAP